MKTNILKIVKKMFCISVEPDNIYHFLGEPKKKLVLNLLIQKSSFPSVHITRVIIAIGMLKNRLMNLMLLILYPLFLCRSLSEYFSKDGMNEISFKGIVYDFWTDYTVISKEIYRTSMNINEITKHKVILRLIKKIFVTLLSFGRSIPSILDGRNGSSNTLDNLFK